MVVMILNVASTKERTFSYQAEGRELFSLDIAHFLFKSDDCLFFNSEEISSGTFLLYNFRK